MKVITFNVGGRVDANASLGHVWDSFTPDVLAVTETWLQSANSYSTSAQIFHAPVWRNENTDRHRGGTCLIVKRGLTTRVLHMESSTSFQCLIARIQNIIVASVYISPSAPPSARADLRSILQNYRKGLCFFTGDFNARHLSWCCSAANPAGKELLRWSDAQRRWCQPSMELPARALLTSGSHHTTSLSAR